MVKSQFALGHEVKQEWVEIARKAHIGMKMPRSGVRAGAKKLKELYRTGALPTIGERLKGKTYEEIYGTKYQNQIENRRKSHIAHFDKIGRSPSQKNRHTGTEYVLWRKAIFSKDNYTCVWCGFRGYLEAHHIKSWKNYPNLRFNIQNGITLCEACHLIANKKQKVYENKNKEEIMGVSEPSMRTFVVPRL